MHRPTLLAIGAAAALAIVAGWSLAAEPPVDRGVTASYEVQGDSIVLLEGDPQPWHSDAWDRWTELVPTSARWRVARFEAIAGLSDGQVEPISNSLQVWSLRIAQLDAELLDVALIHELGHLISLGPSQVIPATDPSIEQECVTYFSVEGCTIEGGVFDRFVSRFWSVQDGWESGDEAAVQRFGETPDSFVTRYAATNPGEDIAETFVFFVYRLRPSSSTVADQKIALLWEFPDLLQLRQSLRQTLAQAS